MKSKDEFIKTLHAKIDEWDTEIERLSAKAAQLEAESREEYYAQIAEMKAKRYQIEEKLDTLQKSGEDAWNDLKSGIELSLESMSSALRSAAERFK